MSQHKDPNPTYTPPFFKQTGFTASAEIAGVVRTVEYDAQRGALVVECTLHEAKLMINELQTPSSTRKTISEFAEAMRSLPPDRKQAFIAYVLNEPKTDAPLAVGTKRPQVPGAPPGVVRSAQAPTDAASSSTELRQPVDEPAATPTSAAAPGAHAVHPSPSSPAAPPQQPAPQPQPVQQPAPQQVAPPQPAATHAALQQAAQQARDAHPDRGAPPPEQRLLYEPEPGVHVRDATHKGVTVPDAAASPTPHTPAVMDYSTPPQPAPQPQQRPGLDPALIRAEYDRQEAAKQQQGNAVDAALGLAPPAQPVMRTGWQGQAYDPAHCRRNMNGGCDNCGAPAEVPCAHESPTPPPQPRGVQPVQQQPAPQQPSPQQPSPQQPAPQPDVPLTQLPEEVAGANSLKPLFAWLYGMGATTKEVLAQRAYALREQVPYVAHVNNLEGRAERWLEMAGHRA